MAGVKGAFARNPYQDMSREQLKAQAKFLGENLKNNGAETHVIFSFAGKKDQSINLRSDGMWDEMKRIWGDKADDALVAILEQQKKKFGKEMMRFSINEEATNLMLNWRRMMLGGTLFNAHRWKRCHPLMRISKTSLQVNLLDARARQYPFSDRREEKTGQSNCCET